MKTIHLVLTLASCLLLRGKQPLANRRFAPTDLFQMTALQKRSARGSAIHLLKNQLPPLSPQKTEKVKTPN